MSILLTCHGACTTHTDKYHKIQKSPLFQIHKKWLQYCKYLYFTILCKQKEEGISRPTFPVRLEIPPIATPEARVRTLSRLYTIIAGLILKTGNPNGLARIC